MELSGMNRMIIIFVDNLQKTNYMDDPFIDINLCFFLYVLNSENT